MSNPLHGLFGGGGGGDSGMSAMLPLMMMAAMPKAAEAPPMLQSPTGVGTAPKPAAPSFAGSSAPAPAPTQTAGKTLLGQ